MKFIHIADVHLGLVPDAGKPWSERRKQDIWDSLAQVFDKAEEKKVDMILIAGDLFHRQPLVKDLKEFNYLCGKLTHAKVALIAGNHDYIHQKSNYRNFDFAPNVIFLSQEQITCVELPEYQTCIYGLSYWHKEIKENLYDNVRPKDAGKINILLAHGGDAKHVPISERALRENGFDYVACGHIHKGGQIVKNRVVMAGSLEPTDCNDIGPHGYWLGDVTKKGCQVSFFPIRKCEYVEHKLIVTENMTNLEILEKLKEDLNKKESYQLYRVSLEGTCDPKMQVETEALECLPDVAAVENHLLPSYDFSRLKTEYKGTLLEKYISEMERGPQNTVTKEALYYGVDALYQAMEQR